MDESLIEKLPWNNNIKNREAKETLARNIAKKVKDGDVISFGSGTTAFLAVKEIAKRCEAENLHITAVSTSEQISTLCKYVEIPVAKLGEYPINWGFDGADEVDKNNWLIKGLGAALYREKMNIKQTPIVYILVDSSKIVERLGEKCPVPVECDKEKAKYVIEQLLNLGAIDCQIRVDRLSNKELVTENGKYIVDARFNKIENKLEDEINKIDGVLENGLFINYNNIQIIKV